MERTDWRSHGLLVTHTRTEFAGTIKHHGTADDRVVRLHFGLRGDYSVTYPEIGRSYDLAGGHHNVLFSSPFELEFVNKTPEIETFGVQFPISQFIAYTDGASDELSRFCERIAAGRRASSSPCRTGPASCNRSRRSWKRASTARAALRYR